MSNATRGRALEHEVRKLFEADGYSCVRGASSKGKVHLAGDDAFDVDLVCTKLGRDRREVWILGVQCKRAKR